MEEVNNTVLIERTIRDYIEDVKRTHSENTALTYAKALKEFNKILVRHDIDPEKSSVSALTEDMFSNFVIHLKSFAPATEKLYARAVVNFYEYAVAERLVEVNLPFIDQLTKQSARRMNNTLPRFSKNDVERVLNHVSNMVQTTNSAGTAELRAMRDRAFLITSADTGLRVHEACNLRRGDIDWNEGRAIIIGKGDKQAVVRFTSRAMRALKDYLSLRAELDGSSGKQLTALPLFARHDKGTGKKVKPITPTTGRNIVAERVKQALGNEAEGHITPHSFRHYFVSTILRSSGNLKLAQALARHENIQITQRYSHIDDDELDKGYYEIFEKNGK
jgi:site-specific recombinase XerD